MDSEDFRWVVLAIQIQHQVGGNLAPKCANGGPDDPRAGATAPPRPGALLRVGCRPYILVGLPIVFTLYLATFRGAYLQPLYTTKMGLAMVTLAVILLGIGFLVIKKMVKVEA